MKSRIKFFSAFFLLLVSQFLWANKTVQIGILIDGHTTQQQVLIKLLRNELTSLLGSKYTLQIPNSKILSSESTLQGSKKNYAVLANDPQVDIIISAGILASSAMVSMVHTKKPVIALGIVDPVQQKIKFTNRNSSGVHNLTYILFNRSIIRDLDAFYDVYPYKKVAIIGSADLLDLLDITQMETGGISIQTVMRENASNFVLVPLKDAITPALDKLRNVDAVYFAYLGRLEGDKKRELISWVNNKKLPSFGFSVKDVREGALAAMAPKLFLNKLVRRIALNVESILNGEDPASLPINISFDENLSINMKTARQIGYSPKFSLMSEAELINEFNEADLPVLKIKQVINEALKANIALSVEADKLKSAQLDVEFSRTAFFPAITFNANGTKIDEDRASASFGQQAETTSSGTLKLQQLIYSEDQFGSVDIQEHLLSAFEFSYQQHKLDIIINTSTAYFDVLRAKTVRNIQKENVKLFKYNLNIAKQREVAGYSGRSDVYYWESQLALAKTDFLTAVNQYQVLKHQLNLLLNRPLNKKFTIDDVFLNKGKYGDYLKKIRHLYVDTPAALDKFTSFLVLEAMRNSPEISQIDANLKAKERRLASIKKKRYVPNVSLVAETQHIFSRNGAGANVAGTDPIDDNWTASLNFSWPLYEGGGIGVESRQVRADIRELKDQKLNIKQSLELNVRTALLDLVTKVVNLKNSQISSEFAEKSLLLIQDAYSKGKTSVSDLADAQQKSIVAKEKSYNSVYEYLSAVLQSERTIGRFSILSHPEEQAAYLKRLDTYFTAVSGPGIN